MCFDALRKHDEAWIRLNEEAGQVFTSDPGEAVLLREIGDARTREKKLGSSSGSLLPLTAGTFTAR